MRAVSSNRWTTRGGEEQRTSPSLLDDSSTNRSLYQQLEIGNSSEAKTFQRGPCPLFDEECTELYHPEHVKDMAAHMPLCIIRVADHNTIQATTTYDKCLKPPRPHLGRRDRRTLRPLEEPLRVRGSPLRTTKLYKRINEVSRKSS